MSITRDEVFKFEDPLDGNTYNYRIVVSAWIALKS